MSSFDLFQTILKSLIIINCMSETHWTGQSRNWTNLYYEYAFYISKFDAGFINSFKSTLIPNKKAFKRSCFHKRTIRRIFSSIKYRSYHLYVKTNVLMAQFQVRSRNQSNFGAKSFYEILKILQHHWQVLKICHHGQP